MYWIPILRATARPSASSISKRSARSSDAMTIASASPIARKTASDETSFKLFGLTTRRSDRSRFSWR